ncbi:MAG TPA: hypothetical protein VHC70_12775 [Phycisphaerales bacterium]|nr:hypothetical protein [Phycisphaerales bacterium]
MKRRTKKILALVIVMTCVVALYVLRPDSATVAPSFETSLWTRDGLPVVYRSDAHGGFLIARPAYGADAPSASVWEAINPVASPVHPSNPIYTLTRLGNRWQEDTTNEGVWEQLKTEVACIEYRWHKEIEPFAFNWQERQRRGDDPVRVIGKSVFCAVAHPTKKWVAVVSSKGAKREHMALLAAGGEPPDHAGPVYVQLFDATDGRRVGRAVRLADIGRNHGVLGNWTPDGTSILCVDNDFKRLWLIPLSQFEITADRQ